MAASEQGPVRKVRGRPRVQIPEGTEAPSNVRIMAAFRMPKPIHTQMTLESRQEGLDLTAYVNRLFDGFLNYFGLPSIVREGLEADRVEMGFNRYEYIQYLLVRRYEATAKEGAGFDKKKPK